MYFSITVYNKPSIKTLQSHGIINDIGPHWYNLGIALLDEDQLAQLQIIRCNHDNETGRCIDLFIYWLQSHPKATWYDLVEKLKSNGVELNTVAEKVEGIFPGLFIKHKLFCTCILQPHSILLLVMPQLSCNCDIEFHDNCGYAYCGYEVSNVHLNVT